MIRRLPLIPTLIVAAAVAVMIGLGIWQLQRAKWKEGLLARYAEAQKLPPIAWPTMPMSDAQLPLFRYATGVCLRPIAKRASDGGAVPGGWRDLEEVQIRHRPIFQSLPWRVVPQTPRCQYFCDLAQKEGPSQWGRPGPSQALRWITRKTDRRIATGALVPPAEPISTQVGCNSR